MMKLPITHQTTSMLRIVYTFILSSYLASVQIDANDIQAPPQSQKPSTPSPIPKGWLPPGIPTTATIQTITRNIEFNIGSGTFQILAQDIDHFAKFGYAIAKIKPDGKHFEMVKNGATAYTLKDHTGSWIVLFNRNKESFLEIEGKLFVEAYFWVDANGE